MHSYMFHVGDYIKDTRHLSNEEDLAYRRLLDLQYDTERPIPTDKRWVSRRLAVDIPVLSAVLDEYFELTENGYINARAMAEIAKYHAYLQQQASNGKLGGRPLKNPRVSDGVPTVNPSQTQKKPNHKPLTINHSDIDAAFAKFWEAYPRKEDKKKAMAAWLKITSGMNGSLDQFLATVLNAVDSYKQSDKVKGGFVCLPTTWLNWERWNDEQPKRERRVAL